jgi:hypothetical protein
MRCAEQLHTLPDARQQDNAVEKGGSERWMVSSKKNNQTKIGSPDKAKGRFLLRETALSPIF